MKGIYIVVGPDGTIYGAYTKDDAAKECKAHVLQTENVETNLRYIITDKNYWGPNSIVKENDLYNLD